MLQDVLTVLVPIDKPQEDPNIRGDAFKTLIVARLSYDATEQDLESEFGRFGPIERVSCVILVVISITDVVQIRIVSDTHQDEKPNKKKKKHRGYAFVVYEREKDMRGKPTTSPTPHSMPDLKICGLICNDMDLKLPILSPFLSTAQLRYIKYGQHD